MSVKKKVAFTAFAVAVSLIASGCGKALVLENEPSGTDRNDNIISGAPVSRTVIKPAESIPEQTGSHKTDTTTQKTEVSATDETPASSTEGFSDVPDDDVPEDTYQPVSTDDTEPPETVITSAVATTTKKSGTSTPKPDNNYSPTRTDDLPVNNYTALNYNEVKGVWISYFELYPILTGKSSSQFRSGIGEYYDNCLSLGINTVYVHVRPYGDAIYKSDYYPWSKYCTGYIGEDPGYDPLEIMTEEAHARGISFQAWINPLRCYQEDDAPKVSTSYKTGQWYDTKDGDYIVKVNSYWWLNPAYKEVTDLIANGVAELVSKYDVDGVHIDDYFYPTTESYFDSIAFNASSYSSLSQFRLDNCSRMVSGMYNAVKSHNPTALFGVSAQGNVTNNETQLYADVEKWSKEDGYVDYMAPQIYYGFDNGGQPFEQVVEQWDKMLAGTGKSLIPGLAVYKIGTEDEWAGSGRYEWKNDKEIIKRQIVKSQGTSNYGGVILYSYQFIFEPDSDVKQAVNKEISAFKPLLTQ
ncbi:MAG: family 10 glycosylhydrolase [Ruminiclostridium sp.]|nr:family 10 glycosylhydrolase [Ruminiclostridium sp.]